MSKPISQSYEIAATPAQVFAALTKADVIQKWSGAPAQIDAQPGTEFVLFGDNIVGKNIEVVPNKKLSRIGPRRVGRLAPKSPSP